MKKSFLASSLWKFKMKDFKFFIIIFMLFSTLTGWSQAKWGASKDALTGKGTLEDAFYAAKESSDVKYIQLQRDVSTAKAHTITGGSFTLDLNGNTVKCRSDENTIIISGENTEVVIIDNSDNQNGSIINTKTSAVLVSQGKVTISGGTYESGGGALFCSIETYGTLTITGGNFITNNSQAIAYGGGKLDLSSHPNPNGISVYNKADDLTVGADNIILPTGYSFYNDANQRITLFKRYYHYTIYIIAEAKWGTSKDALTQSGTFEEAVAAIHDNHNIKYIQIQKNVTTNLNSRMFGRGDFTLDLNDCTLTGSKIQVLEFWGSEVNVIITDNSENKEGKVIGNNMLAIYVWDGAKVTIEGGYFESTNCEALNINSSTSTVQSTVTIKGGIFKGKGRVIWSIESSLLITNGEFGGTDLIIPIDLGTSTTITGGTFAQATDGTTIRYRGGKLDLSHYPTTETLGTTPITDIGVSSYYEDIDGIVYDVLLPPNYYFYRYDNKKVDKITQCEWPYTIGNPNIKYIISFVANNGTEETMANGNGRVGINYYLPECTFTAPKGKKFKAWSVGNNEYQPGDKIIIRSNTIVTALWIDYTPEITITDGEEVTLEDGILYKNIVYNRTLNKGKFGTIILPFVPDATTLSNYVFYELISNNGSTLTFKKVDLPVAGKPYLYKLTETGIEGSALTASNVMVSTTIIPTTVDGLTMTGTFDKLIIDCTNADKNYYAYSSANNEINRVTKSLTVNPFRTYFTTDATSGAKQMQIVFTDETTGIRDNYEVGIMNSDGAVYDLQGRKVKTPAKGLYIVNGKKVNIP